MPINGSPEKFNLIVFKILKITSQIIPPIMWLEFGKNTEKLKGCSEFRTNTPALNPCLQLNNDSKIDSIVSCKKKRDLSRVKIS